jgi:hypothetical protein
VRAFPTNLKRIEENIKANNGKEQDEIHEPKLE